MIFVIQDQKAFQKQIVFKDNGVAAERSDDAGKTSGGNDGAFLSKFLVDAVDKTVG